MTDKKATSFPLRMPRTMQQQIRDLAHQEGISINQFINIAVAEKIVRLSSAEISPNDKRATTTNPFRPGLERESSSD